MDFPIASPWQILSLKDFSEGPTQENDGIGVANIQYSKIFGGSLPKHVFPLCYQSSSTVQAKGDLQADELNELMGYICLCGAVVLKPKF